MNARDRLRAQLAAHHVRTKRSLGQCFLVDDDVLSDIAAAATRGSPSAVVEIGAGPGTLTRALAERAPRVVAIERDPTLFPVFRETTSGLANVQLVEGDALEQRFAALAAPAERPAIAGNLPYSITSPLLLALLEQRPEIGPATVMIQREVADRLDAEPGTKAYGSLTVLFALHARIGVLLEVGPESFDPEPAVHSTVLRIEWLPAPSVPVPDLAHFERVLRASFGQRRKTLRNALSGTFSRDALEAASAEADVDLARRGETLDVGEFARLASALAHR